MKRNPSRAPSPTPTAFSGISNYRSESYRPLREKGNNLPAVPSLDQRIVAKTHFDELSRYLAAYLARAPANSRSTARQKLTRLTKQQFQELSTDVYDELVRRKKNSSENEAVPFLPVRDDFHPKRNQARQKLATLPTSRFEDLSSDVYFELARRYPEFQEEAADAPTSASSAYDDVPSPDFPTSPGPPPSSLGPNRNGRSSEERGLDSGYGGSSTGRRPSDEPYRRPSEDTYRRRPSEDEYPPARRSEDAYGGVGRSSEDGYAASTASSRRRPSQDINSGRRSADREREREREREFTRRPGTTVSTNSDSTGTAGQSATATSGMIIPNKSTIAEEDIEVPYGRDARDSTATATDERDRDRGEADADSANEWKIPLNGLGGLSGLSGLSERLGRPDTDDEERASAPGAGRNDDYFDKMSLGRASVASDRSVGGAGAGVGGAGSRLGPNGGSRSGSAAGNNNLGGGEDQERMRRDYEYKIATMQSRIQGLERDLGDQGSKERKWKDGEDRVRQMEEELTGLRRRAEEQSATMRALQKELDELRETRSRDKDRDTRRAREDEEELQILRERCERLEDERGQGGADPDIVDQLRTDMEGLLTELSDLSRRNDELMTAKDSDLIVIRDLDMQLKEYKRKYEQAKTELRSVKATSQIFLQAPKQLDDQLPVAADGGLLDIHVTSFVSAIDSLLTAGRSNAPTRVLTPMKSVVNAVSAIVEDARLFERRPLRDRSDVDQDVLRSLRDRLEATLSNLVTASKTHATSSGMSPVSLLDAAASHVSATVTEIGRTVCIRKATRAEQEDYATPSSANTSATNGYSPALRAVDEIKPAHQKNKSSLASVSSRRMDAYSSPSSSRFADLQTSSSPSGRPSGEGRRALASEPSSSDTNSPPPIFDQPPSRNMGGVMSDDSANAEGSEDAWAELKPYLEAQTESIVYAIQSVLSGVRSPTPSPTLNENLTQIITIVSSIVAVCNDNLPPATAVQGNEILRELSDHANKLSEVQAMPEVTKESRQVMAKSSFAVANAMKGLMKL